MLRFSPEGGCFARNHFKRSVSARFIAYEASSHRTSPRGSSWVQALPGKFRGNHNPGFDRGNFCPFPGAYLGSHTPGIPGISGSTWEHTHPGAYSGRETRVFPGGRWEPRNNPGQNLGKTRVRGLSRVVLLGLGVVPGKQGHPRSRPGFPRVALLCFACVASPDSGRG